LNLDFNYLTYLNTLRNDGLNLTRTITGAYVEPMGAFNIAQNTLAPKGERFICPWARSSTPGYPNGGNKFDLSKWDDAYFKRLNDFVRQASRRRIVVEMNLFCPFYEEAQWKISPQNAVNNINNVGAIPRTNVYTLDQHGGLLAIQEALVRKIVTELKDFDNVYYELCNEPYFGGVTIEWQHHIADVIVDTEKQLGVKHLISQNIANNKATVQKPHPGVSIFNFHYASPPETVSLNYGLNKAIGDNETGFKGTNDTHYRMEAWEFMLAGGALYNNLDYSFVAGHEKGDFAYPKNQPGGGSPAFRRQMKTLQEFLNSFEFIRMKLDKSILKGGLPEKAHAQVLAETGRQYAIYIFGGEQAKPVLDLPEGNYKLEWVNPFTGKIDKKERLKHKGGHATLTSPAYKTDVALKITK
ncbi:MAG: Myo-inositol 2-dehydrogenase, partial [Verrucomicrobiales bacterium]|nr:Myo-inositol 2-dehydrogenase [Verrucomicrobiales bacterium]